VSLITKHTLISDPPFPNIEKKIKNKKQTNKQRKFQIEDITRQTDEITKSSKETKNMGDLESPIINIILGKPPLIFDEKKKPQ
jgi:hypothetical protein